MYIFTKAQIEQIVSLSLEAGEIAKKSFQAKDFEVMVKKDGSKVTSCDIEISKFFREKLSDIFPYSIICEEALINEVYGENFFLIDPIDGTSSFIKGSDEFCINLAFVQNRKAVFGLIYAPLFESGKLLYNDERNNIIDGINNKF